MGEPFRDISGGEISGGLDDGEVPGLGRHQAFGEIERRTIPADVLGEDQHGIGGGAEAQQLRTAGGAGGAQADLAFAGGQGARRAAR